LIDLNPGSNYVYGQPYHPPPPVDGIITDPGMGKTRLWREIIAAQPIVPGDHAVVAVPLHRLGDEIVTDLKAAGIEAFAYRGRNADDPLAPGHKMCREQERVKNIEQALGDLSTHACKRGAKQCQFYDICGYQRQQRVRPAVSVITHQMIFQKRPAYIRAPDALAIDERFWNAGLRGHKKPERLWISLLQDDRHIPRDPAGTADLIEISNRVYQMALREQSGWLRREAIIDAGITESELALAYDIEWRRKKGILEVDPGMPLKRVLQICGPVQAHNQDVRKLAILWDLLLRTVQSRAERSPYLYLRHDEKTGLTGSNTQPAIRMLWRADIHDTWLAPTTVMDATMVPDIVRQFFPGMAGPVRVTAPMPHTYVRQIVDRYMSAKMLIPSKSANERTNQTRENNCDRVREFIEVRANDVWPGQVVVICRLPLKRELTTHGSLPPNVVVRHYNSVAGQNDWENAALLIVIDRTEPAPGEVEKSARALFDAESQNCRRANGIRR